MNNNQNEALNQTISNLLSTTDKNKLEKVTNMIQNMSSDDLNNLVRMLSNNSNNNR